MEVTVAKAKKATKGKQRTATITMVHLIEPAETAWRKAHPRAEAELAKAIGKIFKGFPNPIEIDVREKKPRKLPLDPNGNPIRKRGELLRYIQAGKMPNPDCPKANYPKANRKAVSP
jgi:hypothetical protein